LQVEIDGVDAGRIVLGLFGTVAPKTVENFRALCACDTSEPKLCYRGSLFHRVIPDNFIQGGDIIRNDGTGGDSIYGGSFKDEDLTAVKFNRKFLLAMANSGPDSNSSQFFITTVKTQWLSGKNVIFGRVMDDSENVVKEVEKQGTYGGFPRADKIVIVDSGEIKLDKPIYDKDGHDPHHNKNLNYGSEQ
jgi:peptidylprolyl isomerase